MKTGKQGKLVFSKTYNEADIQKEREICGRTINLAVFGHLILVCS